MDINLSRYKSKLKKVIIIFCFAVRLLSFSGYVQGMSDILSPILVVMENEVDAFWCFAGAMERVVSIHQQTLICFKLLKLSKHFSPDILQKFKHQVLIYKIKFKLNLFSTIKIFYVLFRLISS